MPDWTQEEERAFGVALLARWQEQVAKWGRTGVVAYIGEVKADGVDGGVALQALRRHRSDFPPSVPTLSRLAERVVQGNPPTFAEAQREIASRVAMLDYFRPASNFHEFVARVGEHHEVTARFAVMLGPMGVKTMPDPRSSLTQSASVRLSAHERDFNQATQEWDADPTRGLALVEARAIAGIVAGEGTAAIAQARREIGAGR